MAHRGLIGIRRKGKEREKMLPYLNFEAAWILRVAKGFEMKFQPLLIMMPSEFSLSPVKLGARLRSFRGSRMWAFH